MDRWTRTITLVPIGEHRWSIVAIDVTAGSMLYRWCICANTNRVRIRVRKRAVIICVTESVNRRRHSTTNGLKALNSSRGHEFFLVALVKSISPVRNSWQKMTCAHTLTTRRVVFVIYRKFGERARNIRESHRRERNAVRCTIYSGDLFLFVLEWLYLCVFWIYHNLYIHLYLYIH